MEIKNIFANQNLDKNKENIEELIHSENVTIEKIVSFGHTSPENFWYEQHQDEWVVLLEGTATLLFEQNITIELTKGDYITIPALKKHRVEKVSKDAVWLAVFLTRNQ